MLSAIVLAAGMSTRMGQNKLLLDFKGKALIAHAVDTLLASTIDEVVVVLGHEAEKVREELRGKQVSWLRTPVTAKVLALRFGPEQRRCLVRQTGSWSISPISRSLNRRM